MGERMFGWAVTYVEGLKNPYKLTETMIDVLHQLNVKSSNEEFSTALREAIVALNKIKKFM